MSKIILTISDAHIPFQNPDMFDFIADLKRQYKPDKIVCLGDLADMASVSHWPSDPDGYSAGHEHELALKQLKTFYKIVPEAIYTPGNHEIRPLKQAFSVGIPKAFLRGVREYMDIPAKWEVVDSKIIDKTYFWHGEPFTGRTAIQSALLAHRMNVVFGHVHSNAGVAYMNNGHSQIWGMNAGCLIDPEAYCFKYGKNNKDKPVLGTGLIIDNTPIFVPMVR